MPTVFTWAQGGDGAKDFGSMANVGYAGLTLVIILAISRLFQGAISRLFILIGIVIGTVVAVLLNLLFNELRAGNKPGASVFEAGESSLDRLGETLVDDIETRRRGGRDAAEA